MIMARSKSTDNRLVVRSQCIWTIWSLSLQLLWDAPRWRAVWGGQCSPSSIRARARGSSTSRRSSSPAYAWIGICWWSRWTHDRAVRVS